MVNEKLIFVNNLITAIRDDAHIDGRTFARVKKHIEEAKTADAVEVVRCKDCIFYGGEECGNWSIDMNDGAHLYTMPNDFCSYGERRGGE